MRDRLITWGQLSDNRRLFVFELVADEAQIIRRIIPAAQSTDELLQTILNAWNNQTVINYPEGTEKETLAFTASGSIVPEGADVDEKVRVASAEREWPFFVVSARLRRQFMDELEELQDVIMGLEKFDEAIFERLKGVWNKVQHERQNETLRHEHITPLKKLSDVLFDKMKNLRRGKRKELQSKSKQIKSEFRGRLKELEEQLSEKRDLHGLFKRLKQIQNEVFKAQLSRDDRRSLKKSLDELFKATKSEIANTGADIGILSRQREHLDKRLSGLQAAIKRMQHSVERDKKDIFYENKRIGRANNQLAAQLGAAKITMIEERLASKQRKLDDMLSTLADLEKRQKKIVAREERARKAKEAADAQRAAAAPVAKSKKRRARGPHIYAANIAAAATQLVA